MVQCDCIHGKTWIGLRGDLICFPTFYAPARLPDLFYHHYHHQHNHHHQHFPFHRVHQPNMPYSPADIPNQNGKLALVTRRVPTLGYVTGLRTTWPMLDRTCCSVRATKRKVKKPWIKILATNPTGSVTLSIIDLNDLDLVKAYAAEFVKKYTKLDILVTNAGLMLPNPPSTTAQRTFSYLPSSYNFTKGTKVLTVLTL